MVNWNIGGYKSKDRPIKKLMGWVKHGEITYSVPEQKSLKKDLLCRPHIIGKRGKERKINRLLYIVKRKKPLMFKPKTAMNYGSTSSTWPPLVYIEDIQFKVDGQTTSSEIHHFATKGFLFSRKYFYVRSFYSLEIHESR